MGATVATQPTGTHNNPLFNLLDNNQPRTSTIMHTPHNGTSPATPADLVEGITQIMNRVTSDNKRDDASKKMMKNIKIFDGSNKAECITWLSQVEAAAKFTKYSIPRINMPEYGTRYATHIFRSISTSIRCRHQRGDLDQLLGYPKYHRSSHITTEHTILHK